MVQPPARSGIQTRVRAVRTRARRLKVVRLVYQNLRYGWFTARNGLWRLLKRRQGDDAARTMAVNAYEIPLGALRPTGEGVTVVEDLIRGLGVEVRPGTHTVYVPPGPEGIERLSATLAGDYPPGAGLKILRDTSPVASSNYLTRGSNSPLRRRLIGSSLDQARAANLLFSLDLGPRVWDVCDLVLRPDEGDPVAATAFVIEHVEGTTPGTEECEGFMDRMAKALDETPLEMIMPGWRSKPDFGCPGCNGNLLATGDGALRYVDFQTFAVDRESWLDDLAERGDTTHFGEEVPGRGGRYLYQSIPGVDAPAKRRPEQRWDTIADALSSAGEDVAGRLVIDVGCNAAMMSNQALAAGAHWAVGLDMPDVASYASELLLALGSPRHTIVGGVLGNDTDLEAKVPEFLHPKLEGSVVLYLAVRATMGLMPSLERFGWRVMVYEGHQGESVDDSKEFLAPLLAATGAEVAYASRYSDGDSTSRSLVILVRRDQP